jgi:hypothetical protein
VPDLSIAASDRPLRPDQYVYVQTHAWWLGTHGPHHYLAEHRVRKWIPADNDREWVLDRELTGAQQWLTGSAEETLADGYDPRPAVPLGVFRARHGAFDVERACVTEGDDDLRCAPPPPRPRGSWQTPNREFFARLPRDPDTLVHRLREENTGSWFGPFAAGVTALRTCLVPADLRATLCLALACLPGVRAVEGVENVDGVACLALVHDAGRTRTELMLSATDGQFAGERDTIRTGSRTGLAAGTVISSTAVRTAVVDEAGALPA